jgi:3-oxoacyl-(acyl-carrier-protein) synthase
MKRRRVKITGIGPVTPAGIGREAFWRGILEPVSRIRAYTKLGPEFGPFSAAYLDSIHPERHLSKAVLPKAAARHTLFGIVGSALAIHDAQLAANELNKKNTVIVVGACVMDFGGIIRTIDSVQLKGRKGAIGRTVSTTNLATVAATIGSTLGLNARSMSVQSSCCTGLDAIGHAARLVAAGEAEIAICGGTDAPLFRCPLIEFRSVGLTPNCSENAGRLNRPFDMWRTTGVISEGAGIVVIEPERSPRPAYAFIDGYAYRNDLENELCGGMSGAMEHALADAQLHRSQIDTISAWGPGHWQVDACEARELNRVFGPLLKTIPTFSIKGAIGSPLGAASAIQVLTAALSLRHAILPPTVNWEYPDPSCALNLSNRRRDVAHTVTLVNAHGLSGVNSSMILRRC